MTTNCIMLKRRFVDFDHHNTILIAEISPRDAERGIARGRRGDGGCGEWGLSIYFFKFS